MSSLLSDSLSSPGDSPHSLGRSLGLVRAECLLRGAHGPAFVRRQRLCCRQPTSPSTMSLTTIQSLGVILWFNTPLTFSVQMQSRVCRNQLASPTPALVREACALGLSSHAAHLGDRPLCYSHFGAPLTRVRLLHVAASQLAMFSSMRPEKSSALTSGHVCLGVVFVTNWYRARQWP